jgi:zinc protease
MRKIWPARGILSARQLPPALRAWILGIALLIACAWPAAARTVEERLPNGLRVIVKEDRRAPTVVQQLWYRAGSIDEQPGVTGVAHVLEHMMFKGTRRFPQGEFSRLVAEVGGRDNAFTNSSATVYHQQVHKSALPLILELESDRMAGLLVSSEEFGKEVRVVMEERRLRTEDNPRSLVYEDLMSTAFAGHPGGWPVIGWMSDLQSMSAEDARAWHRRWYSPGNAVLVIVGDVDAAHALRLVRKFYGKVAARPLPPRKELREPPQRGMRRANVKAPAEQPYLLLGYKVPSVADARHDWEPYALDVLAGVLFGHESARLNQLLVRERRIAHSVGGWYGSISRAPALLVLEGVPVGETGSLEQALREQVARLAAELVPEDELVRVKTQMIARELYNRDSLFRQALEMGEFEIAGKSWRDVERIPDRLRSVTAAQVREVAQRYLSDDRMTVAVLDPQPIERSPKSEVR